MTNAKKVLPLVFGVCLSALAMVLTFRNIPAADLFFYLGRINYWWIIPTVLLIVLAFILRVMRWRIILHGSAAISFRQAFHPLMIGFMINCILPGRMGELARPVLLKKSHKVPFATGVATIAAERIFDMVFLMALFVAFFSALAKRPGLEGNFGGYTINQQILQAAAWGLMAVGLVLLGVVVLISLRRSREALARLILGIPRVPFIATSAARGHLERAASFLNQLIDNFASGLTFIHHPKRQAVCFGLTAGIWGVSALSYYVFAMGCPGIDLSIWELTTVMVVVCFSISLPSVPGFWGVWEAGGIFALSLFGVAGKEAAGFTLVNHAIQILPVIAIGMASALLTSVNILRLPYGTKELTSAA